MSPNDSLTAVDDNSDDAILCRLTHKSIYTYLIVVVVDVIVVVVVVGLLGVITYVALSYLHGNWAQTL